MSEKEQELVGRIRQMPLPDRLGKCHAMIGSMCKERRPPYMSIPTQWYDEDVFISQTLRDAKELISAANESEAIALARRDERDKTIKWCIDALGLFEWPDYLHILKDRLQSSIIDFVSTRRI